MWCHVAWLGFSVLKEHGAFEIPGTTGPLTQYPSKKPWIHNFQHFTLLDHKNSRLVSSLKLIIRFTLHDTDEQFSFYPMRCSIWKLFKFLIGNKIASVGLILLYGRYKIDSVTISFEKLVWDIEFWDQKWDEISDSSLSICQRRVVKQCCCFMTDIVMAVTINLGNGSQMVM